MILCNFGAHFAPKLGFEVHLDFWPKSLPKNAPSGTGKQHGLASSKTRFLTCAEATPDVKKVRLDSLKNYIQFWRGFEGFPAIFLQHALETMILKRQGNSRAWPVHQGYFPYKTHPSKRGNSMAWPVQRIHFWHTCHPTPMPNYSSEVLILLLRQCHTKTIQAEPQTDGHQTGQQHGQAGSTKPFLDRVSPTLDAKRCAWIS